MAEVKSHEFDRFAEKSAELYRIFVIYGPDRGLVSERAALLAGKTGVSQDDPFAMLKLDVSDLQGDPGRLLDEVNSLGLFGGSKLVWLRGAANEKPLLDAMQVLADGPAPANILIVEAGDLKKGSGLRKIAEPSRSIAVIPCYADDVKALNSLIDSELGSEGLRISPGGRQRLLELLGGDRVASRNEIASLPSIAAVWAWWKRAMSMKSSAMPAPFPRTRRSMPSSAATCPACIAPSRKSSRRKPRFSSFCNPA